MSEGRRPMAFWLFIGSLIVAIGGSSTVLSAFDGDLLPTYAGILLFMFGYKISWYGVKPDRRHHLRQAIERVEEENARRLARTATMFVIGGAGIAGGIYLFARAVVDPGLLTGLAAGVMSFGGYLVAHRQLNEAVI